MERCASLLRRSAKAPTSNAAVISASGPEPEGCDRHLPVGFLGRFGPLTFEPAHSSIGRAEFFAQLCCAPCDAWRVASHF